MDKVRRRVVGSVLVPVLVLVVIAWGAVSLASNGALAPGPSARVGGSGNATQSSQSTGRASLAASPSTETTAPATPADVDPTSALSTHTSSSPSGESMPLGNLPGWKQVFSDDFTEGAVPLGSFPGSYGAKWSANYFDGTPDTAGQKDGGRSGYYPSKVLSIHDGVLDMYLHSEKGISMGAAPAPKFAANSQAPYDSQTYGMYSVRFRSDALQGFKTAWLLWPDSDQWPRDGEIDYPEQDLAAPFFAALHSVGSTQETASEVFPANASFQTWNTATIEWTPGRVEFFLNGKSIGSSTSGVPSLPMHYILQTESCLPACPNPNTRGHLYVDWIAIWALG